MGRLKGPAAAPAPATSAARPGNSSNVDPKGLERFHAVGHRIHGNRSRVGRQLGLGKDHLHVAVDDATRVAYAEVLPAQDGPTCTALLQRTQAWFARPGIPMQAIMTDNAKAYTSGSVQAVLRAQSLRHLRTRPYRPQTNDKAERFIQTALRRWAYQRPYRTSAARNAALPEFIDCSDCERPHRALGGVPPLFHFLMRCQQRP